jgi:hypothetical protein
MAESPAQPTSVVTDQTALRIVLFGMPAAGKTSLLGALAQAGQTQEHLLHGRLADPTHGLSELQHRLYDEESRRTAEEVVPYAVDFEPFAENGLARHEHQGAVLIDCDGRVANDLLLRRRTLPQDSPEGTLAREVLAADTLVLVIDASAPAGQLDADFGEFVRFLRLLEGSRGERSEVGGLPVFLVLAKCDLLAQPNDAPATWLERIQERERQVQARFTEFLARKETEEGPLPFGRIDLRLWATSVKRPPLAGVAAKPREPYGVAELFRQSLDAAQVFRNRQRHSGRRLAWTVAGAGTLVAIMIGLAGALISGAGPKERNPGDLETRIEAMHAAEGQTAAERFRGDVRQLEEKIGILTELKQSPQFAELPAASQSYVTERLDELEAYVAYLKRLQSGRQPAVAHREPELRELEETLKTKGGEGLALPREDWSQTRAGRLHHDRLEDVKLLRNAIDKIDDWFQQKKTEGERLWTMADYQPGPAASINWRGWHTEVRRYLDSIAMPPFAPAERLPGASSPDLKYQTVFGFDRIRQAADELESLKKRLVGLRDLSAALGLGGPPAQALLIVPPGFTATAAARRVQELRQSFPDFEKAFPEVKVPDAARGDVRQAAMTSYQPLLEAGRDVILRRVQEATPGGPETPMTWQTVRTWLADPPELASWRILAQVLLRIGDPERGKCDPVTELSTFLSHDSFDLALRRLALELPDAVKLRPDGDLTITQASAANKKDARLTFTVSDKQREPQRGVTVYLLRLKEGSTLTYHPGDDLIAQIPVRDGDNREMQLTWARGRSQVYQFEHLVREPRLHRRSEEAIKGQLEPAIHLSVPPEQGSIPRVPDLVPVVKFTK